MQSSATKTETHGDQELDDARLLGRELLLPEKIHPLARLQHIRLR